MLMFLPSKKLIDDKDSDGITIKSINRERNRTSDYENEISIR